MNASTYTMMFLSFFFVPLAVFSIVAVFARPVEGEPRDAEAALDDYLISSRDIAGADFINSSAAYMLQVSTTFYFVFWGYNYGFSNVWYLISWAIGIFLFSRFTPKLLDIRDKYETLPSFLSSGAQSPLRYIASAITIFSFLAIFYVESYFCVDFISILANSRGETTSPMVWWFLFLLLTFLTIVYSLFGGMRRVVITDRWQISFAYFCISVLFAYLIPHSFRHSRPNGVIVSFMMLVLFGALYWFNRGRRNRLIVRLSIAGSFTLLLVTALASSRITAIQEGPVLSIPGPFRQLQEPWGWFTLLGFTLVNILWQFCDNSNYQRIASTRLNDSRTEAVKQLRALISRLIVVSPLTWGLGIVLGIAIRMAGIRAPVTGAEYLALLASIKHQALMGNLFAMIAILALSAALTSIMMETVDAALIAFAQTLLRDMVGERELRSQRIALIGISAYIVVVGFALLHHGLSSASILTVMAGAYSALVVLAIPALFRMLAISLPDGIVIVSILLGFGLTWLVTFGPIAGLPWNVKIALPLYAGPIGSGLPLLIAAARRRRVS